MKVGLISDVHSNRVALETVLAEMPPVDELLCAGDAVGYNPWPAACVDELRERDVPTVMGNHDAAVAGDAPFRFNGMARAGVEHAKRRLDDDQLAWLEALPAERFECDGRVKLVHGHPDDPDRYTRYTHPDEFSPRLLGDEDVLVLGHTHVQGVRKFAEGIVVNPGSVGQPRDGDPRAGYAVVDLDALTVETHRVEYDIEAVQAAVEEAGLPDRIGRRLARGK
ncbi:metallophosphoesterase family protein [Haloterrigena alkaliphila]|uniref:Metallophosphoesterase family protein n=1 Tax=Haloterrigena alkaliphila TaxID=2816475 RepID=A0A8A2VIY4_9EURY|nr:metallophosphoesterase family protein [Haloterrigena alkaliphila]QSX00598.1 metallophosphatase family protein [Haloterrigena alkaliphila]